MLFVLFFQAFEKLGIWRAACFFWVKIFRPRRLTAHEIAAARLVFADGQIPFDKVWLQENSRLCRLSGGRALASFRIIHYPERSERLNVLIHELAHVAQFEAVGARYAPEALLAQWEHGGAAYDFEKDCPLCEQTQRGGRFSDLNREAQAQLVEHFFIEATRGGRGERLAEFAPFIEEMRAGRW